MIAAVSIESFRVAFYTDNGIAPVTIETADAVRRAAQILADAGARVEEARPDGIEQTFELTAKLFAIDGGAGLRTLLQMAGTDDVHPLIVRLSQLLHPFTSSTSADAVSVLTQWGIFERTMLACIASYDVLVCPVSAWPALPHGMSFDDAIVPGFSYTETYNLTGWPAVVVRAATSPEGLPIGVQIVARPWRENAALAVAKRLEAGLGGFEPPALALR